MKRFKSLNALVSKWRLLDVETIAYLLNVTPGSIEQFMIGDENDCADQCYIPHFTLFGQKVMTQKMFKDFIKSKGGKL